MEPRGTGKHGFYLGWKNYQGKTEEVSVMER